MREHISAETDIDRRYLRASKHWWWWRRGRPAEAPSIERSRCVHLSTPTPSRPRTARLVPAPGRVLAVQSRRGC